MAKESKRVSPFTYFAKTLATKHVIGYTIKDGEMTFSKEIPEGVENKFKELYIYKIGPILAHHPIYGYFILMTKDETYKDPIIIWAEVPIVPSEESKDGVEKAANIGKN